MWTKERLAETIGELKAKGADGFDDAIRIARQDSAHQACGSCSIITGERVMSPYSR